MAYLGQSIAFTRFTLDANGLPTAGDSNPTATLLRNGEATAETVTVTTTATTGQFKYVFTVPGGWDVLDVLQVTAAQVIDSETYRGVIWEENIDADLSSTLKTGETYRWTNINTSITSDVSISEIS